MYWTLFLTFVKIGMFTIGGGYAMIPLIEREVVNRGWLAKQDFIDLFAVTQSIPGIFAVNISIFVGYKLKNLSGSIICALGTILPSFVIILAIALFFNHFEDNVWVVKIFNGIRPAVVALIVVPCITAARSMHLKWLQLIFPGYRGRPDLEMRSIPRLHCIGRHCRRIDLYFLDKRKTSRHLKGQQRRQGKEVTINKQ